MLRRLLGLAIAAFLAFPGAALAADPKPPSPVTGHYYYLAAVEQGGKTVKLEGKLWIEGDQLGASVGCNSIGARVTFDLRTLTIVGDLATTLIGCPKDQAAAEAALVAALGAGPFARDGSGFTGKGARIVAGGVGTAPVWPADEVPPDKMVDPNGTVSSPIIDPAPFDLEQCRKFISQKEWDTAFGTGLTGSGSRDGGSGSGGGSSGSTGDRTTVDRGTVGASVPGSTGTSRGVPRTGGVVEPAPAIDLTLVGPGGKPPVVSLSGPAPTPTAESCRQLGAQVRTMAAAAQSLDESKATIAGAGAELARNAAGAVASPADPFGGGGNRARVRSGVPERAAGRPGGYGARPVDGCAPAMARRREAFLVA